MCELAFPRMALSKKILLPFGGLVWVWFLWLMRTQNIFCLWLFGCPLPHPAKYKLYSVHTEYLLPVISECNRFSFQLWGSQPSGGAVHQKCNFSHTCSVHGIFQWCGEKSTFVIVARWQHLKWKLPEFLILYTFLWLIIISLEFQRFVWIMPTGYIC